MRLAVAERARSAGRRRTRRPPRRPSSRPGRCTSRGRSPRAPRISSRAGARGSPPIAGVGCRKPASSIALCDSASWARIGVARCWRLPTLTTNGWPSAVDPDGVRAQRPLDPPHDDPVLVADLGAAQHRLAEVVVDCGVRAAGRSFRPARPSPPPAPSAARAARGSRRGRQPGRCRSRSRSRTGRDRGGRRTGQPDRGLPGPRPSARGRARPSRSSVERMRSTAAATIRS